VSHARAREYWRKNLGVRISTRWHDLYAQASGVDDERYVPEDVFYADIEPALSTRLLGRAFVDKNLYDRWLPREVLPDTVFRCVQGRTYDLDYQPADPGILIEGERYIVKPSLLSGGGKQVELLSVQNGAPLVGGRVGKEVRR
jgi:hypothetical protein